MNSLYYLSTCLWSSSGAILHMCMGGVCIGQLTSRSGRVWPRKETFTSINTMIIRDHSEDSLSSLDDSSSEEDDEDKDEDSLLLLLSLLTRASSWTIAAGWI